MIFTLVTQAFTPRRMRSPGHSWKPPMPLPVSWPRERLSQDSPMQLHKPETNRSIRSRKPFEQAFKNARKKIQKL